MKRKPRRLEPGTAERIFALAATLKQDGSPEQVDYNGPCKEEVAAAEALLTEECQKPSWEHRGLTIKVRKAQTVEPTRWLVDVAGEQARDWAERFAHRNRLSWPLVVAGGALVMGWRDTEERLRQAVVDAIRWMP